jgi:hypothetical protein
VAVVTAVEEELATVLSLVGCLLLSLRGMELVVLVSLSLGRGTYVIVIKREVFNLHN